MRFARWLLARFRRPDNYIHRSFPDSVCTRRGFRGTAHWMYVTCPECLADPRFEDTCKCTHVQSLHINGAGACQQEGYMKFGEPYVTQRWWCACEKFGSRTSGVVARATP